MALCNTDVEREYSRVKVSAGVIVRVMTKAMVGSQD